MTPTTPRRACAGSPPPLTGDETELFNRYQHALRRVVSSRSRACPQTVEDACSTAWMQLVATQPRRDRIFGWLCTVATREAWRMSARSKRHRRPAACPDRRSDRELARRRADAVGTAAPTVEERVCSRERVAALAALAADDRQLLLLAAAGYKHDEIAASTGRSVRAVRRRIGRARRRLLTHDPSSA